MNVMSWNCRGTSARGFSSLIKDMRREYESTLIFLLETHSSGVKARKQAHKLGFSGMFIVDSQGQAGGLWCLWDEKVWKVDVVASSDQYVHLKVTWRSNVTWFTTAVYANPRFSRRQALWDDLKMLAESMEEPWMVLGDFNSIAANHERKGGAPNFASRSMRNFCSVIQDCNLLDAGFQGSMFTWKNGRLQQRLDRVLINIEWRLKFQGATVFHLPFYKSDHRALLVKFKSKRKINKRRRPFRFLAAWLTHQDFPVMMNMAWPIDSLWSQQINHLQGSLVNWNKRVFGNIFERKKKLMRGLEEIDKRLVLQPSSALEDKQNQLWLEYDRVLGQEELLWYQKSRSKWLQSGDRNTKYFHGVTAIRRKRNSYDIMQDDDGSWIGDPSKIEELVTNYYKNLFLEEGMREPACISGAFPKLSTEELRIFNREITRGDIFNAVSHMGSFKAPGPDGLQAGFFKSQWKIIGPSFCRLVGEILNDPSKVSSINETFLTLIPKIENVCRVKDFRPISLCNVSYKIITKLLAQKLRLVRANW